MQYVFRDVSKLEADAKSTKKAKTGKKNEENYIPKFDKLKKMIIKPDALWHEQVGIHLSIFAFDFKSLAS